VPTLKFAGRYHATRSNRNACTGQTEPDTLGFALGRLHGKMRVLSLCRRFVMATNSKKPDTLLTHSGSNPHVNFGVVNPPVYHASTILHPTVAHLEESQQRRFQKGVVSYGRYGTPTTFALEDSVAALEGGDRAIAYCSGAAACYAALLGLLKTGDHLLMVDTVYGPVRAFCGGFLKRFGVETTFYDPMIGSSIASLVRDNTKIIYLESPGSITFEVQDVPAIVAVAKARGIATMLDNTWASPLFYQPLKFGVDVSIIAGTKYIVGHSDVMMGFTVCTEASFPKVRQAAAELGYHAAPDDVYLALRGLRTAGVRMRHQEQQALALARWLERRSEVDRVLHPALPDHPGHEFWLRDFTGSSGLFGVVLRKGISHAALSAMLDGMELFGMGASWGGYESLILPTHPERMRTAKQWDSGPTLRIHAGLEDLGDLIGDLERGFARMNAAR
jgi:cystathionine beta-lyase